MWYNFEMPTNIYPIDDIQWTESQMQMYVATKSLQLGLLFHADGNGNYVNQSVAGKKKLAGARAGWPDMVYIIGGRINATARIIWLELKTNDGRLSNEQMALHSKMIKSGCEVHVVYGYNGADMWNKVRNILGI